MLRRLLLPSLTAAALLLAAVTASSAPAASTPASRGPVARLSDDATDPTTTDCSDDPDVDLPACDDLSDDSGDVCQDAVDLSDDTSDWADDGSDDVADDSGDSADDDGDSADDDGSDASDDDAGFDDDGSFSDCVDDSDEDVAPSVSSLRAALAGGTSAKINVSFELDLPGTVDLTLTRLAPAVQRGGRCVVARVSARKASAKAARTNGRRTTHAKGAAKKGAGKRGASDNARKRRAKVGKPCTKPVALRGETVFDGDEGVNVTTIRRRWHGLLLPGGSYRLTATPELDGGVSATTSFSLPATRR
jgi:hypothetical protein